MNDLVLLKPEVKIDDDDRRLNQLLDQTLERESDYVTITNAQVLAASLDCLLGKKLLFAVHLGKSGLNTTLYEMVCVFRDHPGCLAGCVGAVIVDGCQEFYTKETGREIVFSMNQAGCLFPGRPLVEATGSLHNFQVQAAVSGTDLFTAYMNSAAALIQSLIGYKAPIIESPNLLCIHASNHKSSNTYQLWEIVKSQLTGISITEYNARNGAVVDCSGCPFKMCLHYSEKGSCFYGGTMVEEAYPAVARCNGILLLAPNYNDALSANLTAFINRLTSLYRKTSFSEKYLFSIIVSGYSGGDIVANQIISALNMNKKFILPGNFAMMETGNDPGSVLHSEGILERINAFSGMIMSYLNN